MSLINYFSEKLTYFYFIDEVKLQKGGGEATNVL